MSQITETRILNIAATLIVIALVIYTCVIAKALLIPFFCAIVVWYLTIQMVEAIQSLLLRGRKLPFSIAVIISLGMTLLIVYGLFAVLSHSINTVIHEAPRYQETLQSGFDYIEKVSGRKVDASKIFSNFNLASFLSTAAYALTSLAGNLLLILIYVMFLLIEYKTFDFKIRALCSSDDKYKKLKSIFARMRRDIGTYLKIKAMVSLLTGMLTYSVLHSFEIKNAEFWSILTFLLNYIPTLGSIVAVVFILLAAAIQVTSLWTLLLLGLILVAIHFIIGNIIEPKYLGEHLNLSPLVILISLAVWGSIWGVIGMLLCVPGMTIISIILSNFKSTRPVSIILSADGKI